MSESKTASTTTQATTNRGRRGGVAGWKRNLLGLYLAVATAILVVAVLAIWPSDVTQAKESDLLVIVLLGGALGSCIHAMTSYVSYVGNETLRGSWFAWYVLRPFIGAPLALVFFFVLRGGLFGASARPEQVNLYGVAAIAGLTGLFAKQATDKLNEVFTSLFRTAEGAGDDARRDKLARTDPVGDVMIPFGKMEKITLGEGFDEATFPLGELISKLGPEVTRIPLVRSDRTARCVIHEGLLCRYVAKATYASPSGDFVPEEANLKDFLDADDNRILVTALAFVPPSTSLADAKEAMEKVEHCRDVFVTEHGLAEEPVLGWLTNVDLARKLGG